MIFSMMVFVNKRFKNSFQQALCPQYALFLPTGHGCLPAGDHWFCYQGGGGKATITFIVLFHCFAPKQQNKWLLYSPRLGNKDNFWFCHG